MLIICYCGMHATCETTLFLPFNNALFTLVPDYHDHGDMASHTTNALIMNNILRIFQIGARKIVKQLNLVIDNRYEGEISQ